MGGWAFLFRLWKEPIIVKVAVLRCNGLGLWVRS